MITPVVESLYMEHTETTRRGQDGRSFVLSKVSMSCALHLPNGGQIDASVDLTLDELAAIDQALAPAIARLMRNLEDAI